MIAVSPAVDVRLALQVCTATADRARVELRAPAGGAGGSGGCLLLAEFAAITAAGCSAGPDRQARVTSTRARHTAPTGAGPWTATAVALTTAPCLCVYEVEVCDGGRRVLAARVTVELRPRDAVRR